MLASALQPRPRVGRRRIGAVAQRNSAADRRGFAIPDH
jgi:hypothetical protein